MFSLQDLYISIHGVVWILVALFMILFLFILFVYRRTNPIVSNQTRYTLIALRVIGLFGVLFLIFEPILGITYDKKEKPTLAVLVDTSASMALKDMEVKRDSVLSSVLNMPVFSELEDKYRLIYYRFAATATQSSKAEIDSIGFIGDATDIRHSLELVTEELLEENLAGIILLTDGAYNLGGNPVRYASEVGVPIHTIGIGSGMDSRDLAIVRISANKFAYLGSTSPVHVELRSLGFPETRTVVSLKRNGHIVDSKDVLVPAAPADVEVNFSFIPQKKGPQKYVVELASLPGEQTYLNNSKAFIVDVLKSKIKILLISGSVNPELGFMRRAIERDGNFALSVLVEKAPGGFYSRGAYTLPDFSNFDVIILLDYPQIQSNPEMISNLLQILNEHQIPVIAFIGNGKSPRLLARFERYLPLRSFSINATESLKSVEPTQEGKIHPIINITVEEGGDLWDWNQLPPVFDRVRGCSLWPDTHILASFSEINHQVKPGNKKVSTPVIVVRHSEGRRSVAILASGLWRWALMMAGIGNDGEFYERLINKLVRWPTMSSESERVMFSTNSESYRCDETVVLQAEVYDDNYQPVDGADVAMTVRSGASVWEVSLRSAGNGHYLGELSVNLPGDYFFQGRASIGQRELGVDQGRFSVGEYEAELLETRAQIDLLKMLAQESEGEFFLPDSVMALQHFIRGTTSVIQRFIEIEIWNKALILMIIVSALVLEWYIRKRKGMV